MQQLNQVDMSMNTSLEWAGAQMEGFQINEIREMYEEKASAKQINIINKADPELIIIADKNMIAVVLRNFLTNSIKLSWKNSDIIIESFRRINKCGFIIQDHGTGMSQELVEKLHKRKNISSTREQITKKDLVSDSTFAGI